MNDFQTSTYSTITALIAGRQRDLGTTDEQVSAALGYQDEAVVRFIKEGKLRLPVSKILALAGVLDVEPSDLLRMSLKEYDPSTLEVIEKTIGPVSMTASEIRFLQAIRAVTTGASPVTMIIDGDSPVRVTVEHAVWKMPG